MQQQPEYKRKVAMVFQRLNGNATLEPVEMSSVNTGQETFRRMKQKYLELVRSDSRIFWLMPLFTRADVELAQIKWVRAPKP